MNRKQTRTLVEAIAFYRTRHRTPGCKLTHMIGVPMLLCAPLVFCMNKRNGTLLAITGTFFQLLGHFLFEKNIPTLIETRDPMSIPAAVAFTAGEWIDVANGTWMEKNGLDLFEKQTLMEVEILDN